MTCMGPAARHGGLSRVRVASDTRFSSNVRVVGNSRGKVDILSVAMLEKFVCECYGAMRHQRQQWKSEYAGITGG